jgi:hypothetical protein
MMASAPVQLASAGRAGDLLLACVTAHGSTSHPYLRSEELLKGPFASRNLADIVHFLCVLHGRHPGVIDHAANHTVEPLGRSWLSQLLDGFADERAFLTRLAVIVGPLPSTPGAGDNDAVLQAQRQAITLLAQSERNGCALGAAMAVTIEWRTIRSVLNAAASRFGFDVPDYALPEADTVRGLANEIDSSAGIRRAMLFGAEQVALQHRGLCDLLEARQDARGIY